MIWAQNSCLWKGRNQICKPSCWLQIIHAHLRLIKYGSNFTGTFCALAIHLTISSRGASCVFSSRCVGSSVNKSANIKMSCSPRSHPRELSLANESMKVGTNRSHLASTATLGLQAQSTLGLSPCFLIGLSTVKFTPSLGRASER